MKSSHFIIIVMKALYCLPKCEVNSQVSLLFLVYKTVVRLNFLGFLIQVLRKKPLVMRKMRYTHRFAWILLDMLSLSSGLFLYNNNHNLFKSLIQNTFLSSNHLLSYILYNCIWYNLYIVWFVYLYYLYYQLINLFSHSSFKVWFHLVPCDVQPSWVTV